jgi:hypothetical protein
MSRYLWRALLASVAVSSTALAAEAQSPGCNAAPSTAAFDPAAGSDAARLRCDLERAASIRDRAATLYGTRFDSVIEIIDTASPSGAAYVYDVLVEGRTMRIDVRSVPDGRGPRCRLQAVLPSDTANSVSSLLVEASDPAIPDYGPREEVTLNPDGSRSVRLVIDSHDIITRAATPAGSRAFSRHAKSDDAVNRLNNLVIGVANLSPGWVCNAAF